MVEFITAMVLVYGIGWVLNAIGNAASPPQPETQAEREERIRRVGELEPHGMGSTPDA